MKKKLPFKDSQVLELYKSGKSQREIAEIFGVSRGCIQRALNRFEFNRLKRVENEAKNQKNEDTLGNILETTYNLYNHVALLSNSKDLSISDIDKLTNSLSRINKICSDFQSKNEPKLTKEQKRLNVNVFLQNNGNTGEGSKSQSKPVNNEDMILDFENGDFVSF